MALLLLTPPVLEPITYIQAADHLRIQQIDEDFDETIIEYLERLVKIARSHVEDILNRRLITQTWKYYLDDFPSKDYIELPYPPLKLTPTPILKYTDCNGTPTTWASSNYIVDAVNEPGRLVLTYNNLWPLEVLYPSNPIEITFACGYGTTGEDVEPAFIQAMFLLIADLWEYREETVTGPSPTSLKIVERLLQTYRIWKF